ncbi:thiamine pyrophosphate-requiring protein [Candidatus Bathyarchaeota archaeon]|nr:thiamine pyrophosphate-requiring protein [Candidatus Bathyarchaeota archaeon]MBS7628239.1 thiamine pyrophosphate-requiring protein [Candidatus Bathyarchaeota archaeon]
MKASEALAKILKIEGTNFLATFPGGGADSIINDAHEAGIRTILVRQERVAINMADGYTRVSSRPGVALVASGVGVENAFSGISQAFADLVPILILAGQLSRRSIGLRRIQDLDAPFILHKVTKWCETINFADRVPEAMRRAFTYLRTGRPSPVFLELPEDVAGEEIEDAKVESYVPVRGWKTSGDPRDIQVAARALLNAKKPLLYAGEGILRAGAWEELRELAELLKAPVMTTMKGKGAFPENHPLSIGCGGRTGGKPAAHFLGKADIVFAIGASLTKTEGLLIGAPIPKGKLIIQSVIDEGDLNKDYRVDHAILGDAKLVLKQVIEEVKAQSKGRGRKEDPSLIEEIHSIKNEWLEEWMPLLTSSEVPINPLRVVWELNQNLDKTKSIVTHDAGCPRDHLVPFYETIMPWGYIGWGHHSTLGFSLGAAMGAKLARPEKRVVNVMGDGAFGMVGMDFETAVREKIPILTIVLNNSGMGTYFKETPSTSALSGSYADIAEALGGYGEKVEKPDEIVPALRRAESSLESGRAALLEIITKVETSFQTRYWSIL